MNMLYLKYVTLFINGYMTGSITFFVLKYKYIKVCSRQG